MPQRINLEFEVFDDTDTAVLINKLLSGIYDYALDDIKWLQENIIEIKETNKI
jgi:hypothetical protein